MRGITFIFLCLHFYAFAQSDGIFGTVKDEQTHEVLPFTNIVFQQTTSGTIANSEGRFTLGTSDLGLTDSVTFSFLGYRNKTLSIFDLEPGGIVYLEPTSVKLAEVFVSSRTLSAGEIIDSVKLYFDKNMVRENIKRELFIRRYETETMAKTPAALKKIEMEGLSEDLVQNALAQIPLDNTSYQDALFELYALEKDTKLVPVEAISLEEKDDVDKELMAKLDTFVTNLEENLKDSSIYYKVKSGVFSAKMRYSEGEITMSIGSKKNKGNDVTTTSKDSIECESDSLFYVAKTRYAKPNLVNEIKGATHLENIPFLTDDQKYRFVLDGVTVFNDQPVYTLSFTPKGRGLYKGNLVVSTNDYGVLAMNYEMAEGKQGKHFHLLGINYAENYSKVKLIFDVNDKTYDLKYMYREDAYDVGVNRDFSIAKKIDRFIGGKTIEEAKFKIQMDLHANEQYELLVLQSEPIDSLTFQTVEEPACIIYQKEYGYTPELWQNKSVMEPSRELKAYKRKVDLVE